MPMETKRDAIEIPGEFVDYRRRLIVYSESQHLQVEFDLFLEALKEFDPAPEIMRFELGNIVVRVLYLRNERFAVGEAIAQIQPRFPNFRLEGDARMAVLQAVNDPLYPQQWALEKIEAEAAWTRVAQVVARAPVTVAVIDSGIKRDHEDLNQAGINGLRIIPPSNNNFADDTGHGTMLAGTIAGVANNARGIAGEAPNARIFAFKFTDARTPPTALAAVAAIDLAVINGARVINASWHVLEDSGLLRQTILYAGRQGCVIVVAAGNYGSNNTKIPTLPASYGFDNMVVVMASDRHDEKSWFSNYGSTVDLAAPGEGVVSTGLYYVNPAYRAYSGTSAAAAHVSGAAALLLAIDDWTPHEIREHLVASADPIPSLQGICRANGRLNLRRAVLGPFSIVKPGGGEQLTRGSAYDVTWGSEYIAPVVNSVEIAFINRATGVALGRFGGLPNNGHRQVVVPNQATAQVIVRVRCEQKNLYADSATFEII
jgi:thermitase